MKIACSAPLVLLALGCTTSSAISPHGVMNVAVSPKSGGGYADQPTPKSMGSGNRSISAGDTVVSRIDGGDVSLGDGSMAEVYEYAASRGEMVVLSMQSQEVDPYVIVMSADDEGNAFTLAADDDGGDGLDAYLMVEFPSTGTYYVVANTAGDGQAGEYFLRLDSHGELQFGPDDGSNRVALLVGAGDYPNGEENDLPAVEADLLLMRDVLIERYGFRDEDICLLPHARATRHNVVRGFREFLSRADSDGVALFFYSGHGTQVDANVEVADVERDGTDDALFLADNSFLLDDEIGYLIDELDAGNVLAIIDACHSGTGTMLAGDARPKEVRSEDLGKSFRRPMDELAKSAPRRSGAELDPSSHVLLAASREIEVSWCAGAGQFAEVPVSIFTFNLARAMHEAGDDVSFGEILRRTEDGMAPWLEAVGHEQVPQLLGTRSGETLHEFLGAGD